MDIKEIIPNSSEKIRIHFIRYIQQPNWYFVKVYSDRRAYDFIVRSLHLPPHGESGYKHLDVEWAFALECENVDRNDYCDFLKNHIGTYTHDEDESINSWITGNGWYEFKDISNPNKWLADYKTFQKENRVNLPAVQAVLF